IRAENLPKSRASREAPYIAFFNRLGHFKRHVALSRVVSPEQLPNGRGFVYPDEVGTARKYFEGAVKVVTVNAYERSPEARRACIEHHGWSGAICELNLQAYYGDAAKELIHVHHLVPIASIREGYEIDPVTDLETIPKGSRSPINHPSELPVKGATDGQNKA